MTSLNPDCTLCDLHRSAQVVCVKGLGPSPCDIMIVGEAPSFRRRDQVAVPFSGQSGKLLEKLMVSVELDRDECYITNVVHCHPPDNRSPTASEIKACKELLESEIAQVKPKYVLLLGATALKAVLGKSKITQLHGTFIEKEGVTYMPTFHPAAALRDPSKTDLIRADLVKFSQLVRGYDPTRQHQLSWRAIDSVDTFNSCIDDLKQADAVAFDLETSGLDPLEDGAQIHCLGLGTSHGTQWILPLGSLDGSQPVFPQEVQQMMVEDIAKALKGRKVVAHNAKFDNKWIRRIFGIRFSVSFDTMIAAHLINENIPKGLKYLAKLHFNAPDYDLTTAQKKGGIDATSLYRYCAFDVYFTILLYRKLKKELSGDSALKKVFMWLMMPASEAFEEIELTGVFVDRERMDALEADLRARKAELEGRLETMCPGVNWNSPKQVGSVLYGDWGLDPLEYTRTGQPSTAESVLLQLRGQHPGVETLLSYREVHKQLTGFIDGWKKFLRDDRMHPSFKLTGTVTGRLCLRENTSVMVPGGTKPIQDIKPGDLVYSYDDRLRLCIRRVKNSGFAGNKPCYRVHWLGQGSRESGFLDATGNHPIRLTTGEYIKVEDLQGGKLVKWRGRLHHGEHVLALHRYTGDYNYLHITGEKKRIKECRVIFEQLNGYSPEHIHHINGDKLDDSPNNLSGMSRSDHTALHACRDSNEMRRRGVESGGLYKAHAHSLEARKERYRKRFSEEELKEALLQGNGIIGACKYLGCSYYSLKRRMEELNLDYDGRTCTGKKSQCTVNNHMITRVEKLPGIYPVYDIEVEETHNFIANELCVHNSCSEPNLQQVPRDPKIRSLITAPPGWTFVEADYSQIELRVAAMLSGDPTMTEIFNTEGADIHTTTAKAVSGKAEVTKDERKKAKAVNFGFLYGMGANKFREYARDKYEQHLSLEEATEFRNRFFELYNELPRWHQRQRSIVRMYGQVRTPTGRIRHLPEAFSPSDDLKSSAERQAINTPVQSFASDITVSSLIEIHRTIPRDRLRIVGNVHDAILFEVRDEYLEEVTAQIREIMENPKIITEQFGIRLKVPIVADVSVKRGGWGSAE